MTVRTITVGVLAALCFAQPALAVDISGTVREAETGLNLEGFEVTYQGAPEAATVGADGSFTIDAPTATTELEVRSSTGVSFGLFQPSGGRADIQILPSGRVYASADGAGAAGVRVRLLDTTGSEVPASVLGAGQQNQVIGPHGLYRFDIGTPGTYRIDIQTDGQAFHFPSRLVPPQSGEAVFDQTSGLVNAPAAPDSKAAPPYWLSFTQPAGLATAPRHHHIPVDRGSSLVVIEKRASKSQVARGDIITWTVRAENRSGQDFRRVGGRGGVLVRDILPPEMRLIADSVRGFVDGVPINLAPQTSAQVLTFQESLASGPRAFELDQGSRITIRYQTVVGVNARVGQTLINRAQVVEPGGVSLSGVVGVSVRVLGDDVFDRSWIRGRVYCDEDGDGWSGEREPGVYGARVYIDTGRYVITDRDGKFHLTDVPPGLRMLKVDPDTVPPNSEPVTRISRALHVTAGIPEQVTFGFRCSTALTGPTQIVPAAKDRPLPPAARVILTGALKDLSLSVDGQPYGQPGAATLAVAGLLPKRVVDLAWGPRALPKPLAMTLTAPAGATAWRIWVEEGLRGSRWPPVHAFGGSGAPPATLSWDGRDDQGKMILARGKLYRLRLEVADGTSRWQAPELRFTVGNALAGPVVNEVVDDPFRRPGELSRKARRRLRDIARQIDGVTGPLVVVRYGYVEQSELDAARAAAEVIRLDLASRLTVPDERVTVEMTQGALRVEVLAFDPAQTRKGPVLDPPLPRPARVTIGGTVVEVDPKSGGFIAAPPRPDDEMVAVTIDRGDGARREILVRLDRSVEPAAPSLRASLGEGQLSLGDKTVPLGALDTAVSARLERIGLLKTGRPELSPTFNVHAPVPDVAEWTFRVIGPAGATAFERKGEGRPPASIQWTDAGVLEPGDYIYTFGLTTNAGVSVRARSGVLILETGRTGAGAGKLVETFRGRLFQADHRLEKGFLKDLDRLAQALKKRPANERFVIEVHADGSEDELAARQSTAIRAKRVRNVLLIKGIPKARIGAIGFGNDRPMAEGTSRAARKKNGRIEIRVLEPAVKKAPQDQAWSLTVDGRPVLLSGNGQAVSRVDGEPGTAVNVVVNGPTGAVLTARVKLPEQPKQKEPAEGEASQAQKGEATPFGVPLLSRALDRRKKGQGPPPPLAVAELTAELPPDGAELGQPLLPIQGAVPADEGIRVRVNDQIVPTKKGRFELMLPLPSGETSTVRIEAVDNDGNVARIERSYRVKGNAIFVMALADGALSQHGTKLEQQTSTLDAGPVLLHGRVALYLKARIKGNDIIEQIRITGYADTARDPAFQNFVDQIIDPEKSYPIYGDASEEVVDAKTRGRYYVAIEADESKLILGTFKAGKWGLELFRYDRMMEGVQVHLQETWVPGYETVVDGFVSYDDDRVRRGHATLRGTGGSLYFLPDKELIEGSEQVKLAIYDRDSGARITTIEQTRDVDYRIDYVSGRLTFFKPVPSTVDSGFLTGAADILSNTVALDGHEVRMLVNYETRTARDVGDNTWGAYAKQTFADLVTVGGGYLRESRGTDQGPDYELWGAEVAITPTKTTRIEGEVTHSTSNTGASWASEDGGLSYDALGTRPEETSEGWGVTVRAETDIGEFLGRDEPYLHLRANYQRVDEGFQSADTIYQQGQERGGGQMDWRIDRNKRLVLRHDTLTALQTDLAFSQSVREVSRSMSTVQYSHRLQRWTLVGELMHSFETDEARVDDVNRGAVGLLARYQVNSRLGVFLEQEFFIGGAEPVFTETLDHFATTVGLDVRLTESLSMTVSERVRWSGEDATAIGLRTQLSDTTSLYIQQRLVHPRDSDRWVPATVVGSEEQWGDGGRSYGEYQLGTSGGSSYNRAVLGVARRMAIMPGFHADIGFERSHTDVMDGRGIARDANAFSLSGEYLGSDVLKVSSRIELRFEDSDHDRLQFVTYNRLTAELGGGFALLAKADYSSTQNQTLDKREAETMDLSLGLVYRPLDETFSLMVKAARIVDMRPVSLDPEGGSLRVTANVIAVEPIIELPLRLQLTPKFAYRHAIEEAEGMATVESHTILAALRLALHVWETLDIAAEYRLMSVDIAEQVEHGALTELAVNITRFARIGVGYNFTSFTDDVFSAYSRDDHGFFVRVTGMY